MTQLIVALDTPDITQACQCASLVKPYTSAVKIGMELFYAHGTAGYEKIGAAGVPIFLDLKLHDIPNTVTGAICALNHLTPLMLTVHTSGGKAMMQAAKAAAHPQTMLLGVTILTSLSQMEIDEVGFHQRLESQVLRMAELAEKSGLDGIVCSPQELKIIKPRFGSSLKTIVPGIRRKGEEKGDQIRTMTPEEAHDVGADYIVVGRSITQAKDPVKATKEIARAIL